MAVTTTCTQDISGSCGHSQTSEPELHSIPGPAKAHEFVVCESKVWLDFRLAQPKESHRPQGTCCFPLTSELKRLEIRSSHLDPDGDHCRGTSHHTARHNWYKSHHSRADGSSPANQKHQHRTFRAPSNTAH